jgi:hypothetical protein
MVKQGILGKQKTPQKRTRYVQEEVKTLTTSDALKMKVKPRHWERFDFLIKGVNIKEIEHFYQIHQKNGLKNECQTLRMLLYKYDENANATSKNTTHEEKED